MHACQMQNSGGILILVPTLYVLFVLQRLISRHIVLKKVLSLLDIHFLSR